jgi:adenosylcobinamide-GDP ribazoletransferase
VLALSFPSARPTGHGASFVAGVSAWAAPIALGIAAVVAVLTLRLAGVTALVTGIVIAFAVAWFQNRRLGGLTGDVLGATVELAELSALLTLLAWLNLRS